MGASRDRAIHTVRGLCVLSMVTGHLAYGTWLSGVFHPVPHVDGAGGFVLVSGLLVGVVQRSTMSRRGEAVGYKKLLRRTGVVWTGHICVCALALVVGTLDRAREDLPSVVGEGGWALTAARVATLQVNPPSVSVLSLYVCAMLASLPLLGLLRRGRWITASTYVLVVYAVGVGAPALSYLRQHEGVRGGWAIAAWFGLFGFGVLVGWIWRNPKTQAVLRSSSALCAGVALSIAGPVLAGQLPSTGPSIRILDKQNFGPGNFLITVVVIITTWRLIDLACRATAVRRLLGPVALLGTRSLDCYLILALPVVIHPSLSVPTATETFTLQEFVVVVATLLACWSWARLRQQRSMLSAGEPGALTAGASPVPPERCTSPAAPRSDHGSG